MDPLRFWNRLGGTLDASALRHQLGPGLFRVFPEDGRTPFVGTGAPTPGLHGRVATQCFGDGLVAGQDGLGRSNGCLFALVRLHWRCQYNCAAVISTCKPLVSTRHMRLAFTQTKQTMRWGAMRCRSRLILWDKKMGREAVPEIKKNLRLLNNGRPVGAREMILLLMY